MRNLTIWEIYAPRKNTCFYTASGAPVHNQGVQAGIEQQNSRLYGRRITFFDRLDIPFNR